MLNYKKILIIAIIALPSRTMANETIPSKKHEENKMHTNTIPIKKIENLFQKTKKTLPWKIFIKSTKRGRVNNRKF